MYEQKKAGRTVLPASSVNTEWLHLIQQVNFFFVDQFYDQFSK